MKWTGNPETDLCLSLVDEADNVIFGQAIKDGTGRGWHAYDYMANGGAGQHLTLVDGAEEAQLLVVMSVKLSFPEEVVTS